MHFQKLITSSIFAASLVLTNSYALDNILSTSQNRVLDLEKELIKEESSQLRKDWVNPINYTYSQNYGEKYDTTKSYISITQPIFKSGGIYNAIKYANAQEDYRNVSIELQKKELIFQATSLLFQLNSLDLSIQKQKHIVENSRIDIKRKTDQVKSGLLDTSFLDNALLDKNQKQNILIDLNFKKIQLENSFNNLSFKTYKEFELPKLILLKEEDYLKQNIILLQNKASIKTKKYFKDISVARFLPTVNLKADYTKYHDIDNNPSITDDSVTNYGFNIVIPLNIQTFNIISSTKIAYLKEKANLENSKTSQINFFKTKYSKIDMLKEKIALAKDDYLVYDALLKSFIQEKNAGFKTKSDVDTLSNSQQVRYLDIKIFEYEQQIELLELYSKIN